MTLATILSLSVLKITGTLLAPAAVAAFIIARSVEPGDGDLW